MTVQCYQPQPVLLPENSRLSRTFYDQRSHLPGKPPLTSDDYNGFETHTIFNDVFLDVDGKHLNAIGPPLVNLNKHLLPLRVSVTLDEKRIVLRHKQSNHDRVTFHRFRLPQALINASSITSTWQFANGQHEKIIAKRQQLSPVQLQFVTLQKNNPEQWVLDWLRYCQSIGVQRVLLYDNNSENFSRLEAVLKSADGLPDVVLIQWPYPYGPVKSFYNQFCQASQNNHAYQCFGQADWTGHFDVDEYLMVRSGSTLRSLLNAASRRWGLVRFDSYWVPDLGHVLSNCLDKRLPTVRDFDYREKQARGKAHKYIARNRHLIMANTHNAKVSFGYRRKAIPESEGAFLHYKSLTNDWRGYEKRVASETLNDELHMPDDTIQKHMKSIDDTSEYPNNNILTHKIEEELQ